LWAAEHSATALTVINHLSTEKNVRIELSQTFNLRTRSLGSSKALKFPTLLDNSKKCLKSLAEVLIAQYSIN
ncbi:hypothetical protein PFISCL1PPCAC_18739, partial [Pristionchus fissidentatus]